MPYPIDIAGRVPLSQLAVDVGTVLSPAAVIINDFGSGVEPPPPVQGAIVMRADGSTGVKRADGSAFVRRAGV